MITKSDKVSLGDVDLTQDEIDIQGAKIRVTMMIDYDLVRAYKELAKKKGSKYQTLMNQKLREALVQEDAADSLVERVQKLERQVFRTKRRKKAS
jgi:hypothetical protein